jgi:hypothetical protein
VEALRHGGGGRHPPKLPVEPRHCEAIVEDLEHKVHLTTVFTAGIAAPSTYSLLQSFTLNLFTTGGTAKQWVVYWNDPAGSTSETFTNNNGFTNPVSESHTYTTAGPSAPIYAVATSTTNLTATAYLGLYSSFGNSPSNTGKSLFTPGGSPYASADTPVVSAVDDNSSDGTTYGDVYSATNYRPTSGSHYEFVITRTTPSGTVDTTWGPNGNGALPFSFDSTGDDIPSSIIVSKTGAYVVVAGKDATGWAIAMINTGSIGGGKFGNVDYTTPSNFHSGKVNALAYDISDDKVSVAGDDGSGDMAAALFTPHFDGTAYSPNWTWSGDVKTYSISGYTASATAAVAEVGNDANSGGVSELENAMVIGGDSVYNSGLDSDFTMIAINKSDGSVLSTFGTNGVIHTFNIGCHLLNPASYDSETSLVTWFGNGYYYLTEVGYSACNISLVRYLCSTDTNGTNLVGASLDTSFGQYNGLALGPYGTANAAVQDPISGTIYTAGSNPAADDFFIAAIDDTGAADSTFANDGTMQIDMGSSSGNSTDVADSIAFDGDTANGVISLVVSGTSNSSFGKIGLADLLPSNTSKKH